MPQAIKRELIPDLVSIKPVDASSTILRARFALEVFGYASVSCSDVESYKIDLGEIAEEYGWVIQPGTLVHSIKMEGSMGGSGVLDKKDNKRKK